MISAEKMFRIYKDPAATADNYVLVEKIIDDFLRRHLVQYRDYAAFTRENPDNMSYIGYTHMMEDAKYDDLTILGIKRK